MAFSLRCPGWTSGKCVVECLVKNIVFELATLKPWGATGREACLALTLVHQQEKKKSKFWTSMLWTITATLTSSSESLVSRLKLSSEFVDKAVRLTVAMGYLLSSVMFGITSDLQERSWVALNKFQTLSCPSHTSLWVYRQTMKVIDLNAVSVGFSSRLFYFTMVWHKMNSHTVREQWKVRRRTCTEVVCRAKYRSVCTTP